jgi:RNA polymerase sigma factor (TIGR02999 family)
MTNVSQLVEAIATGDPDASAQLLPLVYDDLRHLAARQLAHEAPRQTLDPTALVHEAYLRLVGGKEDAHWGGCNHFFAAAAAALRRILVENVRRKRRRKRGGDKARPPLEQADLLAPEPPEDVLALDEALTELAVGRVGNDCSVNNMSTRDLRGRSQRKQFLGRPGTHESDQRSGAAP